MPRVTSGRSLALVMGTQGWSRAWPWRGQLSEGPVLVLGTDLCTVQPQGPWKSEGPFQGH